MKTAAMLVILALVLMLSGCAANDATASKATPSPTPSPIAPTTQSEDSSASDDEQNNESENTTTDDDDADSGGREFHGYDCKGDCSGHEAGYQWAEDHDIHDPDQCGGKSESFIEGCRAWAEENP